MSGHHVVRKMYRVVYIIVSISDITLLKKWGLTNKSLVSFKKVTGSSDPIANYFLFKASMVTINQISKKNFINQTLRENAFPKSVKYKSYQAL